MSSQQHLRRAMSLALAIGLLAWAQSGLAMPVLSGHGAGCKAHMHHSAGAHAMMAGCCPGHELAKPKCPAHPSVSLPAINRPDCCSISSQPSRLGVFLIASGRLLFDGLSASRSSGSDLAIVTAYSTEGSPPPPLFAKAVFDQKADLRI